MKKIVWIIALFLAIALPANAQINQTVTDIGAVKIRSKVASSDV